MFGVLDLFSNLGSVYKPEVDNPTGGTPANGYVAEDGVTFYVAEDGVTFYVQET